MSDQETKKVANDENVDKSAAGEQRTRDRNRGGHRKHKAPGRPLEHSVNMEELRELVELISEYGFTDFELENKDVRVRLRRDLTPPATDAPTPVRVSEPPMPSPAITGNPSRPSKQGAAPSTEQPPNDDENLIPIPSPIVGTFYRSASPTSEPFVKLGSQVSPDTTVCIIEAMKLMNEIQAEITGVIAKIYVENGQPVEYGQPLFGLKN
jgi:acetyl-CoA carboxylase biotin carboxyl carrier protein